MKILHSSDWHLDSPLMMFPPEQRSVLRRQLLSLPGKIGEICKKENCQMMLLAGDIFDGSYTKESYRAAYDAFEAAGVPVFISPGNHDHVGPKSPWKQELWPANVHIFLNNQITSVAVPQCNCRVYGAGFEAMDCPGLLEGFRAECREHYAVGVFHGDPIQTNSPCNPITAYEIQESGLDYLALGHIHKGDSFVAGQTLCAWPGCPMGRGFDEQGKKGVLITEIGEGVTTRFVALDGLEFYDWETEVGEEPVKTLSKLLPPVGNENYYRITFAGESDTLDIPGLISRLPDFPNLVLRDKTTPPVDIWQNAGEDSFEGIYFGLLRQALEEARDQEQREKILLAAKLSRRILEGQEVTLP